MNNSLVSTIIQQPHKLSLHLSTVLITSRPVSSGNLLHIVDQRVEILGFTQHQIRDYIKKSLDGSSTRIQKLVQHLEEHPVIEGYCYVPLHAAILVHVFLTMKEVLPTTLHELFCSLVLCCIVREQATHEPDTSLPELSSLDDLPDDLKSKLNNLSILAYNGVMKNKIVFYSKDLQASHLPTDLPSLGLLQAVEGLTLCSTSLSYNYLHLSVQELLAAYNISQMVPSEQVKVFMEFFESSRFQAVLHYYCGFTKLASPEIKSFLSSFQVKKSNFKELLPLLHCFFEAQRPSLCRLVDPRFIPNQNLILNSEDLTPFDFLVVGYFITSLLSISTTNIPTIHLVVNGINDHCLKMLLNGLSKHPNVGEIPALAGALSLRLVNPFIADQAKVSHNIAFLLKTLLVLSELVLSFINLPLDNVLVVGYFITSFLCIPTANTPTIHLVVDGIDDHDHRLKILLNELSKYQIPTSSAGSLSLELHSASFTEQGGRHIASYLKKSSAISDLKLSKGKIHSDKDFLLPIVEAMQMNTFLTNLSLPCMNLHYTEQNGSVLTKMLQVNKSLTHLDLSFNNFSDSGARCIFVGLQYNNTLVYLNLSTSGIQFRNPDTAMSLSKMLQVNKSLAHLDLSNYCFHAVLTGIISCIFEGLEHNTTLRYLNIRGVSGITDADAEHIARVLKSNNSLQILDIAGGMFLECFRSGIPLLLESLMFNSTLQTLYISDIDSETLSTFKRAREAQNLPPINFAL